jgi:Holliday junction resolvase
MILQLIARTPTMANEKTGNPFMDRIAKKGKSGHGTKSEQRLGKSLSARMTPASGALEGAKGDMVKTTPSMGKLMIEAKSTVHNTMSLDLGWLVKVATEALADGATPALTVSFVTPDGKARNHGDWVMMPAWQWKELVEK